MNCSSMWKRRPSVSPPRPYCSPSSTKHQYLISLGNNKDNDSFMWKRPASLSQQPQSTYGPSTPDRRPSTKCMIPFDDVETINSFSTPPPKEKCQMNHAPENSQKLHLDLTPQNSPKEKRPMDRTPDNSSRHPPGWEKILWAPKGCRTAIRRMEFGEAIEFTS